MITPRGSIPTNCWRRPSGSTQKNRTPGEPGFHLILADHSSGLLRSLLLDRRAVHRHLLRAEILEHHGAVLEVRLGQAVARAGRRRRRVGRDAGRADQHRILPAVPAHVLVVMLVVVVMGMLAAAMAAFAAMTAAGVEAALGERGGGSDRNRERGGESEEGGTVQHGHFLFSVSLLFVSGR